MSSYGRDVEGDRPDVHARSHSKQRLPPHLSAACGHIKANPSSTSHRVPTKKQTLTRQFWEAMA